MTQHYDRRRWSPANATPRWGNRWNKPRQEALELLESLPKDWPRVGQDDPLMREYTSALKASQRPGRLGFLVGFVTAIPIVAVVTERLG